jgi:calcineurin-like phosphoesterase family protein
MNEVLVENWNSLVKPEDTVWHLGDVALCRSKEDIQHIVSRLNGHKSLIIGNHDYCKKDYLQYWTDIGFEFISKYPIITDGFFILSHEPLFLGAGIEKSNINHMVNICGHTHQNCYENKQYVNVCVECTDYKPINFDELILTKLKENK